MIRFKTNFFVYFSMLSMFLTVTTSVSEAKVLKISAGRNIDYNYQLTSAKNPTLVFLPGVNRSVPNDYQALQILTQMNYNVLTMATSSHWESLKFLKDETPYYVQKSNLSSADFMEEVEILIQKLNIENPILVGLSYSSSMQVHSGLPQVFVAPLVKAADTDPAAAAQARNWEAGLALNPIFGATLIRQFRDNNYRQFWSRRVTQELSKDRNFYEGVRQDQVINGYVSISKAAEDFDLSKIELGNSSLQNPHVFILAENEQQNRLKGQIETAILALQRKQAVQVIIVRNAEHNIPSSAPKGFVTAINAALTTANQTQLEVGIVSTNNQKVEWLQAAEIKKLFSKILNFENHSTELADLF